MSLLDILEGARIEPANPMAGADEDHPLEYFWRFESRCDWGAGGEPHPYITAEQWFIHKHTPRGVWLVSRWARNYPSLRRSELKLVIHGTRKAWAYPTKAEAWRSFLIRQNHRVQHAKNNLERVEAIHALAQKFDQENRT